jgi:hypothetical protein
VNHGLNGALFIETGNHGGALRGPIHRSFRASS